MREDDIVDVVGKKYLKPAVKQKHQDDIADRILELHPVLYLFQAVQFLLLQFLEREWPL